MATQIQLVHFVGGPYDGHEEIVKFDASQPRDLLILPVNENMFRMVHGEHRGPRQPLSSLAVYQVSEERRYEFIAAAPAEDSENRQRWI